MSDFQNFVNQNKNIDPKQTVEEMLKNGQVSQYRLNQAWNEAQGLIGVLGQFIK